MPLPGGGNADDSTPTGCAIGDVFYADGTCGNVADYDGSKTPVGVVYALSAEDGGIPYDTATAEKTKSPYGRVINLRNLTSDKSTYAFDPENPYDNSLSTLYFGLYSTDVSGLTNYDTEDKMLTALQNDDAELYSGKENTQKFANATPKYSNCTNGTYTKGTANYNKYCVPTTANAALSFYPPTISKSSRLVGAGNWYLPAIGELALLYGLDVDYMTSGTSTSGATGTTKTKVNATLTALKSKGVDAATLTNSYYWSSVEDDSYISWVLYVDSGNRTGSFRFSTNIVRVSLEFNLENATPGVEDKIKCDYTDQASCESANANSTCTKDSNGCYVFSGCKDGYVKNSAGTACEAVQCNNKNCAIGDIYYSDGTCCPVENFDCNKTPVGVVYALSATKGGMPYTASGAPDRAEHGRVINLRDLTSDSTTYAFDPENPYDNSYAYLHFGLYSTDVSSLTNYSSSALMLTALQNDDEELYSGKENTQKFASATPKYSNCTNGTYTKATANYNMYCAPTAANAALSFYPPEVSKTHATVGAGNWYLPALGELALLYGFDKNTVAGGSGKSGATGTTKTKVNNTLTALKSKGVDAATLTNSYYWSSVEYNSLYSWSLNMNTGGRSYNNRSNYNYVRVSLEF